MVELLHTYGAEAECGDIEDVVGVRVGRDAKSTTVGRDADGADSGRFARGETTGRDSDASGASGAIDAQIERDAAYMALALEEARAAGAMGEVPIGAVVVYEPIDRGTRRPLAEPRVIARAHNRRETDRDPAGHAEFLAMKEAARVLDAWRLTDCTVYVTLEPCIMCAGLMHQARVSRCVYGAPDRKAGALGTLYQVHADARLNHQFEVTAGVREGECVALLRAFFRARRKKAASPGAATAPSASS